MGHVLFSLLLLLVCLCCCLFFAVIAFALVVVSAVGRVTIVSGGLKTGEYWVPSC